MMKPDIKHSWRPRQGHRFVKARCLGRAEEVRIGFLNIKKNLNTSFNEKFSTS